MNLRELNYILIPGDNERWDAWARTRWGRRARWFLSPLLSLTREGQAVATAVLVTGAAGVDVTGSHLYLVFCGLMGLLVAALLVRPFARLGGVELRVERPPRVEAGQPLTLTAVLRNTGKVPRFGIRVQGPFLPWDGTWVGRRGAVPVLMPGETVRVPLRVTFSQRGDRYIGRLWATSVRPLGLAGGRPLYSAPVRVMVVPPLRDVRGPAPRPAPGMGTHGPRALVGTADELVGVRPYRPGDRIRDLHAGSWARLGEPMVREYAHPLRAVARVHCVLAGPEPDRDSVDGALTLAGSLTAHAVRAAALVSLTVDGGQGPHHLQVGHRAAGLELALDLLGTAEAHAGGRPGPPHGPAGAPLEVVFAGWDDGLARWWAQVRQTQPRARGWVVHRQRKVRAAAEAAGLKAVAPARLADGVTL
ncbi:MAG: DUF58 domain-containing protein [Myxococcales bacterium]|nr:DUF58 domain-containing protein [Myxococcales bacterium]